DLALGRAGFGGTGVLIDRHVGLGLGASGGLGLLGGVVEVLESTFEGRGCRLDGVDVSALERVLHRVDLGLDAGFEFSRRFGGQFGKLLFDLIDQIFGLVLGVDGFSALAVFLGVGFRFLLGLLDLLLGKSRGTLDR